MKKIRRCLLILLVGIIQFIIAAPETNPTHFQPVYIGNPYLAMNIYLTAVTIDGLEVVVGDEIGIFDGDICVGAKTLTEPIGQYLAMVAATDDPTTPEKDGFTPGNPISYRLWDYSTQTEITNINTVYTQGDAVFSSQGTAVLEIHGSSAAPTIQIIAPVPDLMVAEDALDFQLADLDNVFSQPPQGKTVTFSVASDTNAISVTLNESHVVWVNLAENWNGVGQIYLHATMDALTVTDTVQLTVTPVNDPPTAFTLLNPEQNATISQADITNFRWTRSYDPDRIGAIQYTLIIGLDNAFSVLDTTIHTGSDTSAVVTRFAGGKHYWKVAAYNTRKDTVWGSGSNVTPWSFQISPVEIKVVKPVADLEVAEDTPDFQLADLDTVFSQPPQGKTVTFSVASDTSAISVTLNESHVVWVSLAENWNGVGHIYLHATIDALTVTDTVQLTVTPVNDPPTAFELVSPENGWSGESAACIFRWGMSSDPDREDTLVYDFSLSRDSSFAILDTLINAIADTAVAFDTLAPGKYYWKVCAYSNRDTVWASGSNINPWSFTIVTVSLDHQRPILTEYRLYNNYPNPFNPTTTLRYELPKDSRVTLSVFDINGREVTRLVNETQPAGCYSITWNASEVGSGIYFYRIQAGEFHQVKKMVLMK